MTSGKCWRRLAAPVLVLAALQSAVRAQDNTSVLPVQLPARNPVDLNARQIPAVQGPGAFTTAEPSGPGCNGCQSPTLWDRCRGRWVLCKDNWHRHFLGDDGSAVYPLGALVDAPIQVQIANAEAACMCLHQYDFKEGTTQLNARGQAQLAKIMSLLPRNFAPVTIEAAGVPQLDEARRMQVFKELSTGSFPIPYERVVCGTDGPGGLRGTEAEAVNENLLANTKLKGNIHTTAGTSFSASSSGGGN